MTGRGGFGASAADRSDDDTDYAHRHFVNLLATAFLLTVMLSVVWTIKAMDEYEKQRSCVDSGRRDCVVLEVARHVTVRAPAH